MADYSISTAAELVALAAQGGGGTSSSLLSVEITADIDMSEYENWLGFTGTWYMNLDGGGHTISNIGYIGSSTWAFIGGLYGSIKNLILDSINISTTANSDIYAITDLRSSSAIRSYIENVSVKGRLEGYTVYGIAAGTVGSSYSNIRKCSFSGTLIARNIGYGIAGAIDVSNSFVSCVNGNYFTSLGSGAVNLISAGDLSNSFFVGAVNVSNGVSMKCGGTVKYGYAVITNASELIAAGYDNTGTRIGSSVTSFFFDNSNGDIFNPQDGATTAQLQDASWLQSKGFAIAAVS